MIYLWIWIWKRIIFEANIVGIGSNIKIYEIYCAKARLLSSSVEYRKKIEISFRAFEKKKKKERNNRLQKFQIYERLSTIYLQV